MEEYGISFLEKNGFDLKAIKLNKGNENYFLFYVYLNYEIEYIGEPHYI